LAWANAKVPMISKLLTLNQRHQILQRTKLSITARQLSTSQTAQKTKEVVQQQASAPKVEKKRNKAVYLFWLLPIITFFLGTWQVKRLNWKKQLIKEKEETLGLPALSVPTTENIDEEALTGRMLKADGEFIHDFEISVSPKTLEGRAGLWVITPFRLTDGRVILVNRGWVPNVLESKNKRKEGQIQGEVHIEGMIRNQNQKPSKYTPDNVPTKNVWYWTDNKEIARSINNISHLNVLPFMIDLCKTNKAVRYPASFPGEVHIRNDHFSYIVTWYTLSAALSVMTFVLIKKRIH